MFIDETTEAAAGDDTSASRWASVLDTIAAQLELQRRSLAQGTGAPPDLEIDPPDTPIVDSGLRLRALALLDESELLADLAVERLVAARTSRRSPYAGSRA